MTTFDERSPATSLRSSHHQQNLMPHPQLQQLSEQSTDPLAVLKWLEVNRMLDDTSSTFSSDEKRHLLKNHLRTSETRTTPKVTDPCDAVVAVVPPNEDIPSELDDSNSPAVARPCHPVAGKYSRGHDVSRRDLAGGTTTLSNVRTFYDASSTTSSSLAAGSEGTLTGDEVGTRYATDQTSVSSSEWGDDVCEFDRQESLRVRMMFDQIERTLFDQQLSRQDVTADSKTPLLRTKSLGPLKPPMLHECFEWGTRFPHFRVSGVSIPPPPGHPATSGSEMDALSWEYSTWSPFQHEEVRGGHLESCATPMTSGRNTPIESSSQREETSLMNIASSPRRSGEASDSLILEGEKVELIQSKIARLESDEVSQTAPWLEEILMSDGVVEEPIAVDEPDSDDDSSPKASRSKAYANSRKKSRRSGCPPMSPTAALRDDTTNQLFDLIWLEVCRNSLRPMLLQSFQRVKRNDGKVSHRSAAGDTSTISPTTTAAILKQQQNSRGHLQQRHHAHGQNSAVRRSSRNDSHSVPPRTGNSTKSQSRTAEEPGGLGDVLQVSSKALSQRPAQQSQGRYEESSVSNDYSRRFSVTSHSAMSLSEHRRTPSHPVSQVGVAYKLSQQRALAAVSESRLTSANTTSSHRAPHPSHSRLTPQLDRSRTPDFLLHQPPEGPTSHVRNLLSHRTQQSSKLSQQEQHTLQRSGTLPPLTGGTFLTNRHAVSSGSATRTPSALQQQRQAVSWNTASNPMFHTSRLHNSIENPRPATTQPSRTDSYSGQRILTPQGRLPISSANSGRKQEFGIHGQGLGGAGSKGVEGTSTGYHHSTHQLASSGMEAATYHNNANNRKLRTLSYIR